MSNMEPEVKDFLKKIILTLFLGLSWLMLAMTLGIYAGLFFPGKRPGVRHFLAYVFLAASLIWLIRFLYRTWKKKFPHG